MTVHLPGLSMPRPLWNFAGAYVVWLMTGVATSCAAYTTYHYLKHSPDVEYTTQMRSDELKSNPLTAQWARETISKNFFRSIANLRDNTVPGGYNNKDTRIFRI